MTERSYMYWLFIRQQNLTFILIGSLAEPHSSVSSIADLRTGGHWLDPQSQPIFFPRIDDSHCDRIHSLSPLSTVSTIGYVGKQLVAWKEYCAEY